MQSPLLTNRKGQKAKQIIVLVFNASNDLVGCKRESRSDDAINIVPFVSHEKAEQYLMPYNHTRKCKNPYFQN